MDRRRNLVLSTAKHVFLLVIFTLIVGTGHLWAQRSPRDVDPERVQAARIAFITSRISLKPEQAEKFWPIFNEFTEFRDATMRTMGDLGQGAESLSEEEAKSRLQQRIQLQQKLLEEEKTFIASSAKVLSYKQILLLQNIAKDFNRHIYQRQRGGGN